MTKFIGTAAAAVLFATMPLAASATVIDFSGIPTGVFSGPIVYPEATFTSSTSNFYIGAAGMAHEICPLTPAFNCVASLSVSFGTAVNDLTFVTTGYDNAAPSIFISGIADGSAFSTSFVTDGSNGYVVDLSAWSDISSITVTNNDTAGLAYNFFTFSASVPDAATWTLMITGFGLTGASLRVRRHKVKLATA